MSPERQKLSRDDRVFKPMDFGRIRATSLRTRKNLVRVSDFATLVEPGEKFREFARSLPNLLAGQEFRKLVDSIVRAVREERMVAAAMGGHVVKAGCSPIIIDLMKRGILKAVAMNGSTAIHDYEIALIGQTSEDVAESIRDGSFGMAEETAGAFARACHEGARSGKGLGYALGDLIRREKLAHAGQSILAQAVELGIPAMVLVAVGTDIVHVHPVLDPAAMGEASFLDFRLLVSVVSQLDGGVWLNLGSAVVLPEAFLKAVSAVRNLGTPLGDFTAANLDMIQHYRPRMNVVGRPAPRGISLTGHHEILLPLLRAVVIAELEQTSEPRP